MTPPDASPAGQSPAGDGQPAVFVCAPETLRKRADFLRANRGKRQVTPGFILLGYRRDDGNAPRVGYTCSKKLGNAVHRNRAKRRLREIARHALPLEGCTGWDYVLIGRPLVTETRDFAAMRADMGAALKRMHT